MNIIKSANVAVVCCGAMLGIGLSAPALAAPFMNGSFETGPATTTFTTLSGGSTAIAGWTVTGDSIDYVNNAFWQAGDGQYSIDLNGNAQGGIQQTFDTIAGATYTVSFLLAGNGGGSPAIKSMTATADGTSQTYAFDTTGHSYSAMGWTPFSFNFVASGSQTTLSFSSNDASCCGATLDGVSVTQMTTAVPEPASWAMLIAGFGAMGAAMRRRSAVASRSNRFVAL